MRTLRGKVLLGIWGAPLFIWLLFYSCFTVQVTEFVYKGGATIKEHKAVHA